MTVPVGLGFPEVPGLPENTHGVPEVQLDIQRGPLQLTPELEEYIHERADFLLAFHREILACRVTLDAPVSHHRKGGPYEVHVDLHIPGAILNASHQEGEELRTAIRLAFEAARRRLVDHVQTRRDLRRAPIQRIA
jgi:ribosome-associated translation inhibitor RaiA